MWPKGIIVAFSAFAVFIIVLVTICMKQDLPLESKEYYKEELAYQQKIDQAANTQRYKQMPEIAYHDLTQQVSINFKGTAPNGKVHFYKPDRSNADFKVDVAPHLSLDMTHKAKGLWKVKIQWTQEGRDFYYETPLLVN